MTVFLCKSIIHRPESSFDVLPKLLRFHEAHEVRPPGESQPVKVHIRVMPETVEVLERTMLQAALERSNGRLEEAARLLGISRKGLFLKRRRWGLGG